LQDIVERTSNDVKILAHKGEVAYQLELPEALSAVHNVFHVSQLKKCHPDMVGAPLRDTVPLEEVQLESALTYEEKPMMVRSRHLVGNPKMSTSASFPQL
jgi:hypothetical protein